MNIYSKKKGNVLLIDDLSDNLQLFSELLLLGYHVRSITKDQIKLPLLKVKTPDVILVNIKTSDISCEKICELIKNQPLLSDAPIIFIVYSESIFNKVKAFRAGLVDYITTPFIFNEVVSKLEHYLQLKRQEELLEQEVKKRKKIEEILGHSRALILSILNNSLDGIAALQSIRNKRNQDIKDFRFMVVNPIFAQFFNRNHQDIIGKVGFRNLIEEINPDFFADFVKVVETGQTLERDFCNQLKDNHWYQFVAVKLEDGFALTVRDITVRKEVQIKLEEGNRQLKLMANLDALTKVANRRCFDDYLGDEWQTHLQKQKPLTLIMIDIDYFKPYNDFYGHQQGDYCLARVAQSIAMVIKRPTDLVARYGGEEFVVILPNTKLPGGLMIAELIEITVASLCIPHAKSQVSDCITLSMGIASIIPQGNLTVKDLIAEADGALYEAKHQGRNRIVSSGKKTLSGV